MSVVGVAALTGLKPWLHLAVDSKDVIAVPHPTHLPPLGL